MKFSATNWLHSLSPLRERQGTIPLRSLSRKRERAGVRGKPRVVQYLLAASVLLAATFTSLTTQAQTTTTEPPPQATPEAGKKLYTSYCARCHGLNMVNNGSSFDLRTFPKDAKERFERSVKEGIKAMPAWGNTLSADELLALWAYVSASP
jgi:cytochrome c55X